MLQCFSIVRLGRLGDSEPTARSRKADRRGSGLRGLGETVPGLRNRAVARRDRNTRKGVARG